MKASRVPLNQAGPQITDMLSCEESIGQDISDSNQVALNIA
ncbi:hypothetical protein SB772_03565 [Paraburkholderia sp. SIMBA_030]